MSTNVQLEQSTLEEKVYPLDFAPALLEGLTVSSATVVHVPPSGSPLTISATVVGGVVYVPIPKGLSIGVHQFSVVANTSNTDHSPEILLIITVMR